MGEDSGFWVEFGSSRVDVRGGRGVGGDYGGWRVRVFVIV